MRKILLLSVLFLGLTVNAAELDCLKYSQYAFKPMSVYSTEFKNNVWKKLDYTYFCQIPESWKTKRFEKSVQLVDQIEHSYDEGYYDNIVLNGKIQKPEQIADLSMVFKPVVHIGYYIYDGFNSEYEMFKDDDYIEVNLHNYDGIQELSDDYQNIIAKKLYSLGNFALPRFQADRRIADLYISNILLVMRYITSFEAFYILRDHVRQIETYTNYKDCVNIPSHAETIMKELAKAKGFGYKS